MAAFPIDGDVTVEGTFTASGNATITGTSTFNDNITVATDKTATFNGNVTVSAGKTLSINAGTAAGHAVEYAQWQNSLADHRPRLAVDYATTAALSDAYTWSGGGKTLTADANGAFPAVDGETPAAGMIYLIKDETGGNAPYNLIYELTQLGDGSNPWILTAHEYFDEDDEVRANTLVIVRAGTTNGGYIKYVSSAGTNSEGHHTVGTTDVTWSDLAATSDLVVASGSDALTISGGEISINSKLQGIKTLATPTTDYFTAFFVDDTGAIDSIDLSNGGIPWNENGTLASISSGAMGRTILGYAGTNPAAGELQALVLDTNGDVAAVDLADGELAYNASGTMTALATGATGRALLDDATVIEALGTLGRRAYWIPLSTTDTKLVYKVAHPISADTEANMKLYKVETGGYVSEYNARVETFDDAGTKSIKITFAKNHGNGVDFRLWVEETPSDHGTSFSAV